MSTLLDIQKLAADPGKYAPNTLYFIGSSDSPDELQIALSSKDGSVIRRAVTKADMRKLINEIAPIGTVIKLLSPDTPDGYLKCNGAIVSKTTYSALYSVIGDQFNVSTTVIGIPWQSQYGFNSSKQEDISGWTSTDNLTTATRSAVSLVTKNYMYILGGSNSNGYLDTIQSAPFDSNGALSSNWSKVGALPVSMGFMGYVATKSRFYLIGGYDGSNVLSTVYSAPINTDGTLGDFRAETPLPAARANAVCFVIKDKLYAIGGYTNTVYRATINSDGSLSSWETLSNFPISFDFGRPLLIKDRIYIFGAYDYNNNKESKNYYATYDSDGNIGSWTNVANMPNDIFISTMVCTDNYVFSMAGYDNNSGFKKATYRAPISADGSIGDWTQISDIPIAAAYAQSTIAGDKIYFIGGYDGSNYLDTVYLTTFTSGITDYTPYYTDQQNTSTTFNLPNYYTNASTGENYYIKY